MVKPWVAAVVIASTIAAGLEAQTAQASLEGVWEVSEWTKTGPNGGTSSNPQPSLYIFTAKYYSKIRVDSDKPRLQPPDLQKASAADLLQLWGQNFFSANAGTYEVSNGRITFRPVVGKDPAGMRPDYFEIDSIRIERNTIWLTQVSTADGPRPNPTTRRLVRLE